MVTGKIPDDLRAQLKKVEQSLTQVQQELDGQRGLGQKPNPELVNQLTGKKERLKKEAEKICGLLQDLQDEADQAVIIREWIDEIEGRMAHIGLALKQFSKLPEPDSWLPNEYVDQLEKTYARLKARRDILLSHE